MTSFKKVLTILKTKGHQSTSEIAKGLGLTTEGARLLLLKMAEEGLVDSSFSAKGVGRPVQLWTLTASGNAQFPDMHADFSIQLMDTILQEIGGEALKTIIKSREKENYSRYASELDNLSTLEEKVTRLAEMRTLDGYIAEYAKESNEVFFLIENHCPIEAAAKKSDQICLSEFNTIKSLFGEDVLVSRTHYILNGDRHCAYRIEQKPVG